MRRLLMWYRYARRAKTAVVTTDVILLETADKILLETGDAVLIERTT